MNKVIRLLEWAKRLANPKATKEELPVTPKHKQLVIKQVIPADITQAEVAIKAGFAPRAVAILQQVIENENRQAYDRAAAAAVLAPHFATVQDYAGAAALLERVRRTKSLWTRPHRLLYIDMLIKSGCLEEAEDEIKKYSKRFPDAAEPKLHWANLYAAYKLSDGSRLAAFNLVFDGTPFRPIHKIDPTKPLTLNNIAATAEREAECPTKLSVLMPAFKSAEMIETAIRSVLSQTWHNLELIVVDDCSPDDTADVVTKIALTDNRVRLFRQGRNQGAYAARNLALSHATGEFVTVHDADDWSHPQKFAVQVRDMISSDSRIPNATHGVRLSRDLSVRTKPFGGNQFVLNTSSLMFRRDDLTQLGGWDEVRMTGDAELMDRLTIRDGKPRRLHRNVPLSFILLDDNSLTRSTSTGVNTIFYGARREYRDSFGEWHRRASDFEMRGRPYPIPNIFRPDRSDWINHDVVLVSDYSLTGGTSSSNLSLLRTMKTMGLDVAVFHWPRFDNVTREKASRVNQYLYDAHIPRVVSGEKVKTKLVIVNHPNLLSDIPQWMPAFEAKDCVVIFNQAPHTRWEGGRTAYDTLSVLRNAETVFGVKPTVAPLSGIIRSIITPIVESYQITGENWTPLMDQIPSRRSTKKRSRCHPVVGRHSRDHRDKWPESAAAIASAYMANTRTPVRLLGGASFPLKALNKKPENWEVIPFGGEDVSEFLASLDFYLYFPHEQIIEAFGRAPMEAMAAGVPVVMTPALKDTFGEAAIYCSPQDVKSTIDRLWCSPLDYSAQIQRGYDFVTNNCAPSSLERRLNEVALRRASHNLY